MSSRAFRRQEGAEASGAAGAKAGKQLERAIKSVNDWYDQRGEAAIEKVNPPTYGWGSEMGLGQSTVDYTGTFLHGGRENRPGWYKEAEILRGIAFDTKSLTGRTKFGLESIPQGKKNSARERQRFMRQVAYLKDRRDRHDYAAFFLLYCADLEVLWICDDLDTLARGESITIRGAVNRADGGKVEHHLRHIEARLELAAVPRMETRRPHLDYLTLIK